LRKTERDGEIGSSSWIQAFVRGEVGYYNTQIVLNNLNLEIERLYFHQQGETAVTRNDRRDLRERHSA
jgi:hypothetical protein